MNDVVIRTALVSEQRELEELQRRASLANLADRDALLANPDAIELPLDQLECGNVFIAEAAGSPVGFAALVFRANGEADLDALFVEPDLWRCGVGRALIEHCVDVARGAGSRALHVVGNPHAERFYSAVGFEVVGTTGTRFGPGLLMRRELAGNGETRCSG
jgi:N-acetylglutamate synthase-like GNAT family acetyltransferase